MVEILLEHLVGEGLEKTWDFNFHLGVEFKPICTCWTPSCPLLHGEAAVICGRQRQGYIFNYRRRQGEEPVKTLVRCESVF